MKTKIYVNLSAIDFRKTLGVWIFGKQLIAALHRQMRFHLMGVCDSTNVMPESERGILNDVMVVEKQTNDNDGVELLLHHFQKPLTSSKSIVIFHDLHLWDVPWKYGNAQAQCEQTTTLLRRVAAVITHFPRTYFDLPRVIEDIPNAFFLTVSPTMQVYRRPDNSAITRLCERFSIGLNDKVIVFPSQYQKHKNHLNLFKALWRINDPGVHLICCGSDFSKPYTEQLQAAIAELDMVGRIVLAGHLSDEDLSGLFHRANLIVSASLAEGGAYIVQEGIQYTRNVAVSRIRPAMMHMKVMGASIPTFDPLDVCEMAEVIRSALVTAQDNSSSYKRISGWTWDRLAIQYGEIMEWIQNGCTESKMPSLGPEELGMALAE